MVNVLSKYVEMFNAKSLSENQRVHFLRLLQEEKANDLLYLDTFMTRWPNSILNDVIKKTKYNDKITTS